MGGIQLVFTDGIQSPVLQAGDTEPYASYIIDTDKKIAKILMKVNHGTSLNKLTLKDSNNDCVVDGEEYHRHGATHFISIGANEAIIGLYGVKGNTRFI